MTSTTTSGGSAEAPSSVPASPNDPIVDRLARGAHGAVDRIADSASAAIGRVNSGVTETLSSVSDQVHGLSASQHQWVDHCRQSVRDHPLAAVGAGLAAGWLIARWLRA